MTLYFCDKCGMRFVGECRSFTVTVTDSAETNPYAKEASLLLCPLCWGRFKETLKTTEEPKWTNLK